MRTPALALLLLAAAAAAGERVELLFAPSTPENRRNSEGDVLVLKDGRLMLAWTEFYTGEGSDWAPSRIAAKFSRDGGRTWTGKRTLQDNIGKMNTMEADLLRLRSGKVLFAFAQKNSEGDCRPMICWSTDDARTFTTPAGIPLEVSPSYTGMNNDRMIQLKSGRVLLPLWYTTDYRVDRHIRTRVYYSDDEGRTWNRSRTLVDIPDTAAGAQEPGVVELKDGRVLMWIRNQKGRIYRSLSADRGETWSAPEPMSLESPLSPQSIKRIPKTKDLLVVWNNSPKLRTPLAAAISRDEGETWTHIRNLDETPDRTFAYTSIEFWKDRVLLSYYFGPKPGGRAADGWALKFQSVPVNWFYGK